MSEFERRFGKYAIPNLTLFLIAGYAVGYVIQLINPEFLLFLSLDAYKILHGQIWRVITWILIPPTESNFIFVLLMLYCCYSIGSVLERVWGTFRYNVFFFSGIALTVVAAFVAYFVADYYYTAQFGENAMAAIESLYPTMWYAFGTYYINVSIYLVFAMTFPNEMVRFMMLIPVRMKWLGLLDVFYLGYIFFVGGVFNKCAVGAAVVNCLLFYLFNIKKIRTPKQAARNAQFQQSIRKASAAKVTRHKCAICGKTEETDPDMQFRFCSKCNGNYEYCSVHLFTHTHVK